MKITPKQYAEILYEITLGLDAGKLKMAVNRFIEVLVKNNDQEKITEIVQRFQGLWNQKNGIINAEFISARKVDDKTLSIIGDYLKDFIKAEKINLEQKQDKSLLGGFILKYEDRILDSSLKNRLRELKEEIIK